MTFVSRNRIFVLLSAALLFQAVNSPICGGQKQQTKSKENQGATAEDNTKSTPPSSQSPNPPAASAAQTSLAKLASTVSAEPELQGDYIPCKFTLQELRALVWPEIAPTLTAADEVALKQKVIDAAISQTSDPSVSAVDLEDFIVNHLNNDTLRGLTPDEALSHIIEDLQKSKKPPLVQPSDFTALQDTLKEKVPTRKDAKAVGDTVDKYVKYLESHLRDTPLALLQTNALELWQDYAREHQKEVPQQMVSDVRNVLAGMRQTDTSQIVGAARAAISAFERPPDIGCAMSILTYKETSQAYGRLIASTYIAVQVVVRNLNRTQSFVLHDVEFQVNADPTGRLGRFMSGRDKIIVRALSATQSSLDPRALAVHSAMGVGAIMSAAVPIFSNASLTNATAVFNGAFVPGFDKYWKDLTGDQLNLLNDTGFSSAASSQTVVPQSGTVMFVTFIPSKQFEEGWWTQSCVEKVYLGTTDDTGIVRNLSTGDEPHSVDTADHTKTKQPNDVREQNEGKGGASDKMGPAVGSGHGVNASRALEVCQLKLDPNVVDALPRHKSDNKVLEIPIQNLKDADTSKIPPTPRNDQKNKRKTEKEDDDKGGKSGEQEFETHKGNMDLFRNAYPRPYKKWPGNSLLIFAELSNVVVSGTHIVEDTQLQPSISELNCSKDASGNLVFPTPEKDTLVCALAGKNLDKISKLRLRNAKDATDTTTAEGSVSVSGDSTTATVTFPTSALHALPQPAYDVFAVSSKGVEQKTPITLHFSTAPYVSKISPSSMDFSKDASAQTLTMTGDHLQQVDTVVLTNASSKQGSISLKTDALKSETQLLVPIDPSALSDLGNTETKLTITLKAGSTTVKTDQSFDYTPKSGAVAKPGGQPKPKSPAGAVALSPQNPTVAVGKTQTFTITGLNSSDITWAVNKIKGGNSVVGEIDAKGLYSAPKKAPSPNTVTVTATSISDSSKTASTKVTIK